MKKMMVVCALAVVGFVLFTLAVPRSARANTVYITPTGGTGSAGTICSGQTTQALSYFNNASNWTSGTPTGNQIGPGTVVKACGTFSVSVSGIGFQFQGSGTPGNVIELLFDPAAVITSGAMGAGIDLNSNSYILLDGGVACGKGTSCSSLQSGTATIENTANGTGLANQVSSFLIHAGYNNGSPYGTCGSDIEVRNFLLLNDYVRNGSVDNSTPLENYYPGNTQFAGCGPNILEHDMTATNGHTCFGALSNAPLSNANYQIYNNVCIGAVWGVNVNSGAGVLVNSYIYNNDINIGTTWQNTGDAGPFHLDPIIVYGQSSSIYPSYVYIYNNYIHGVLSNGQSNACPTGLIFLDQNVDHVYAFNNTLEIDGITYGCNGDIALGPANTNNFFYNNTIVGSSNSNSQAFGSLGSEPAFLTIENNIISTVNGETDMRDAGDGSIVSSDYNVFYNLSGSSAPGIFCAGNSNCYITTLSSWHACTSTACTSNGGEPDAHSTTNNPNLAVSYPFTPGSGSSAINAGANLYSLCNGQPNPGLGALCYDAAGNARPSTGAWTIGAYNATTSTKAAPAPPTGVTGVAVPQP